MAKILIADDSIIAQKSYQQMLDFLGHEVVTAENGLEAVKLFREGGAELIIMDVEMPVMNGFDATREIRKSPKGFDVPIIIVSAADDEKDITDGMNAGANDYLVKPVKEAHLVAKLKTFLKISAVYKADADLAKNHVEFAGRYVIEKLIGYGAHALIYLAKDKESGKDVVVKLITTSEIETFSKAFIETAGKLKTIDCPNILKIYDFGQYGGKFYLVLEYANGGDLAGMLKSRKLNEKEAVQLALDMTTALKELAKKGLIHFDIKPQNIMRSGTSFKLGDFGIISERASATIPIRMEIWATASYLPPEYLDESGAVDGRCDIYSLGITLYQAVSGDNPFASEKPAVSMFRQLNFNPTPLKSFNKEITPYFSDLVSAMMNKKPDDRPSLEQMEIILKRILEYLAIMPEPSATAPAKEVKASVDKIKDELDELTVETKSEFDERKKKRAKGSFIRSVEKFGLAWAALVLLCIIILSVYTGNILYCSFIEAPSTPPGTTVTVICPKCLKPYEAHIIDIGNERCKDCGVEPLSYSQKCLDCGNEFPYHPENAVDGDSMEHSKSEHGIICPRCQSMRTMPSPTNFEKNLPVPPSLDNNEIF